MTYREYESGSLGGCKKERTVISVVYSGLIIRIIKAHLK